MKGIHNAGASWKLNNPRHMLGTRKVLDDIKTCFFELDGLTFDFTLEQKDKYLMLWVQNLKKMTGQIRKTAAKDALKQLQDWQAACGDMKMFRGGQAGGEMTGARGMFLPVTQGNHSCGPNTLLKS